MKTFAPARVNGFTPEYIAELRREAQRKGARIRVLAEALIAKALELEAERRGFDPRRFTLEGVTIDDKGRVVGLEAAIRRAAENT